MTFEELQTRVEQLERELAHLKAKLESGPSRWWVDHAGRFKGDKDFRTITRLGKAYRRSLKPRAEE
jgi:hypothetical protein